MNPCVPASANLSVPHMDEVRSKNFISTEPIALTQYKNAASFGGDPVFASAHMSKGSAVANFKVNPDPVKVASIESRTWRTRDAEAHFDR